MPVPNMNTTPKRDALLIIAFGYEAPATAGEYQQMGSVRVIRAEANRDLMIRGLKNTYLPAAGIPVHCLRPGKLQPIAVADTSTLAQATEAPQYATINP